MVSGLVGRVAEAVERSAAPLALVVEMDAGWTAAWNAERDPVVLARVVAGIGPADLARVAVRCAKAVAPLLPPRPEIPAALAAFDAWIEAGMPRAGPRAARALVRSMSRLEERCLKRLDAKSLRQADAATALSCLADALASHASGDWEPFSYCLCRSVRSAAGACARVCGGAKRWTRRRLGHRLDLADQVRSVVPCPTVAAICGMVARQA